MLPVKPEDVAARLPRPLRELFEFYALADSAALAFQNRIKPIVRSLFIVGPLALVCLEIYAHLWSHCVALVGYLGLLGWGLRYRRDSQGRRARLRC